MATLTNEKIKLTYAGLIKTNDSGAIGAVAKPLTDGLGNAINMEVLTGQINFPSGTVDFTGSTVNGLGIQPAGLVAGTVANSMESSASLTTTAANAVTAGSIAIGDGAVAGTSGISGARSAIAIGKNAVASTDFGDFSVAIGFNVKNVRDAGVALGRNLNQPLGTSDHYRPVAIGSGTNVRGGDGIGIGTNVDILGTINNNKIAIGTAAVCNDFEGAVALGAGVTAATANTVTIKKLQMLDYATLNYADDTAAATGGIPLGGVYHTSGALKIRIA
jgi:trimeric autotransporter adhesin